MRSRRTCVSIGHIVGGGSSEEQWCQGKCESKHARKILHTLFYEFGKQYLGCIPHNFAYVTQQYRLVIDRYKMVIVYEHESKMFLDKNGFSLQASMQRKPARMPTKGPLKDMLNCWRSCWFTLSVNLLERQQKICKKICLIAGVLAGLRWQSCL